jgi:hypothetical protein
MVIHNIVELAGESGLQGVNEGDFEELLQSHGESLTNGELHANHGPVRRKLP